MHGIKKTKNYKMSDVHKGQAGKQMAGQEISRDAKDH
jgi:hypothetical protein